MELSFSDLRAKEVVNTQDGKKLGKVCDLVFCYPENKIVGLVVPAGRGVFKRDDRFIAMKNIVRIGEDVILVDLPALPKSERCKDKKDPPRGGYPPNGAYPPNGSCPPNCYPPNGGCTPRGGGMPSPNDRRSFEEYE